MKIGINSMSGGKIELDVSKDDTILDLKYKIEPYTNLDVNQQVLIFSGKTLKNTDTIEKSNISDNMTISLVISLRGG